MNRIVVAGLASLAVLACAASASAQQSATPPAPAPAPEAQPPPPAEKSAPLAGPETGTRHPSAGSPETGYHGSSDPKSSTGANLPGQNVSPPSAAGQGAAPAR